MGRCRCRSDARRRRCRHRRPRRRRGRCRPSARARARRRDSGSGRGTCRRVRRSGRGRGRDSRSGRRLGHAPRARSPSDRHARRFRAAVSPAIPAPTTTTSTSRGGARDAALGGIGGLGQRDRCAACDRRCDEAAARDPAIVHGFQTLSRDLELRWFDRRLARWTGSRWRSSIAPMLVSRRGSSAQVQHASTARRIVTEGTILCEVWEPSGACSRSCARIERASSGRSCSRLAPSAGRS